MRLHYIYAFLRTITAWSLHLCASQLPCFRAFGLPITLFSLQSVTGPLIGYYHNTALLLSLYVCKAAWIYTYAHHASLYSLISVYHIPTLCGALYWQYIGSIATPRPIHRLCMAALPLACMLFFITDSVGSQAWIYSTLWIIPIVSTLIPHNQVYFHAVASTLIMHSIGSLFWLVTHTTTAAFWIDLLPIACIERLIMATGMTVVLYSATILHTCYTAAKQYLKVDTSLETIRQQAHLL